MGYYNVVGYPVLNVRMLGSDVVVVTHKFDMGFLFAIKGYVEVMGKMGVKIVIVSEYGLRVDTICEHKLQEAGIRLSYE